MELLTIKDKQAYLDENYPFEGVPKLTEQLQCLHCDNVFTVGDYKVIKDDTGFEFICCPHAPDCNGTVIDWFEVGFWDESD